MYRQILRLVTDMDVPKIFSKGRSNTVVDLSRGNLTVFFHRGGATVVKFHFTRSKLRKKPFFANYLIGKCQFSKSEGGDKAPLPTPMVSGER